MKKLWKIAFMKTIPVMMGYVVLGIGFGILAEENGYGFWWVLAMSALIYAGSMQYVTVSLLAGGASLITAGLTTLMVNARHLFYGISMIDTYKDAGNKKPYLMFSLTDETYSLVCAGDFPEGMDKHDYCLCVSFLNQLYWVTGSVLGALIGYQIDRIRSEGKTVAGKAIRNMVILVAALAVFGMLLSKCAVGDQKSYGYCPNCHTRIETKYIRNGSCWRCN